MTPQQFIQKWRACELKERSASQSHFLDLCRLLDEPAPTDVDPEGTSYSFEAGAKKVGGGDGWADVWKKDCFAWEYKGKHADLNAAYAQLQRYAVALENPPLLVVSDMETIRIHTNFTRTVQQVYTLALDDLLEERKRRILKWVFTDPDQLKPGTTREDLTKEAAAHFAEIAQNLHMQGYEPRRVAHFINKMMFCLFAEDIGILPRKLFSRLLEASSKRPERFEELARRLFAAMKDGGDFDLEVVYCFNGGLFDDEDVLKLEKPEIDRVLKLATLDWSAIEPSIFGTLFERGLDPSKRSQLGAHYTDRTSIMRIVDPVVLQPLHAEWERVRDRVRALLERSERAKSRSAATKAHQEARRTYFEFLQRLQDFRVLDPACGSGNFLYLSLLGLKDLEHRVILEGEALGLQPPFPMVDPQAVLGIEINPYAAELARVTIWIGQIQWMLKHGYSLNTKPVLQKLDQIDCRDALLNPDGSEAAWLPADCIVGNPPFLGDKKMISELGEDYVTHLRRCYAGRVPGGADLVTYWFEKAWRQIEAARTVRAGLVATNSIRSGRNRKVMDTITASGMVFEAWSDEPWILDGAAVRVSIACFSAKSNQIVPQLNGGRVDEIYPDLTGKTGEVGLNVTVACAIRQNKSIAFQGTIKTGRFEISGEVARRWLQTPANPNGRPNSDVLRPWVNGMDVTRRPFDRWIIDFADLSEQEAALYEGPFEYLSSTVRTSGLRKREKRANEKWWLLQRSRPEMRKALSGLPRYIATPRMATHRLFVWMDRVVLPDCQLFVIARDDDTSFGVLHSRFHELWTLRQCSWEGVGNDPRYTGTTTFEKFPFPLGLEPNVPAALYSSDPRAAAIADAARCLSQLRENWLNPPELTKRVPEVVPGFPDRVIPLNDKAARELKKRTLTALYNQRPAWLSHAHLRLDEAVAAAYGWPVDIKEDGVLKKLLELNLALASAH